MNLDLRQLVHIVRRRWWILILITLASTTSAYVTATRQTPLFEATAVFVVNPGALVGSNDNNSLQDSQRLATTYAQLLNTQPMRDRVASRLGMEPIDEKDISVSTINNTLLIEVSVTHPDPDEAALIANTYVAEFQGYIRDQNSTRITDSRSRVDEQIDHLNGMISAIDTQLATAVDTEIDDLQQQRRTFLEMVTQLESDAARSEMNAATASAFIESVDPALPPDDQSSPLMVRTTVLGALVGLMIAVGLVALLEYLDNTIRADSTIRDLIHAPVLAVIPGEQSVESGGRQVFSLTSPQSGAAEALRLLRTNITFASIDNEMRILLVTSGNQTEGKSTVAANLAVTMAQNGLSVALVDADLRKPTLHKIFNISMRHGVTTYITNRDLTPEQISHKVALPGLTLIPCGPLPPNPAEMMASTRFRMLVENLKEHHDMVILDSAPVLQASDSLVAAALSDGVVIVTVHRKTRMDSLQRTAELLGRSGANLLGVVVNRVDKAGAETYGGAYYGTYYGSKIGGTLEMNDSTTL